MSHVLTFVASDAPLDEGHIKRARDIAVEGGAVPVGPPAWQAKGKAADIFVARAAGRDLLNALRGELGNDRIDVFCMATATRAKKLLLADMESTIVDKEALDELADFLGLRDKIAAITHQAMEGKLDFKAALRERVALLKGLRVGALDTVLKSMKLNPGARALVATLKSRGANCVLVSGGFTFFTQPVAHMAGFDQNHGNIIEERNGILTGSVADPILDKNAKLDFLNKYLSDFGLKSENALTIGDGANDIPMLKAAGDGGFGYRPKRAVEEAIDNLILYGDLAAPLYAMGIAEAGGGL